MSSYQRVIVQGNVGRDPEVRQTASGKSVTSFSVAVNERRGQDAGHTEWFNCVCWEKTAEIAGQYLHKGDQVLLEGRLQTREWQDRDGQQRRTTELIVDRLILQSSKQGSSAGNNSSSGTGGRGGAPAAPVAPVAPAVSETSASASGWGDDDIPF